MECDFCNKKNDDITVKSETHVSNKFTEKCYGCFKNVCYNCIEPFCDDCNVRTCKKCCYKHNEILCGCYGKCYTCGTHVTRGSKGWPCIICEIDSYVIFNCRNCRQCDNDCNMGKHIKLNK